MGYRDPGFDAPIETGFSTRFEWDGERWLYRRGGRGAPVEVTRDEMLRSVEIYENGTLLTIAILIGIFLFGGAFYQALDPTGWVDRKMGGAVFGLAVGLLFCAGNYALVRFVTRGFAGRPPQGPAKSWLEVRRSTVREKSWQSVLGLPAYFIILAGLMWWLDEKIDWVWFGLATLFATIAVLDVWLKLQLRRSKCAY
jgi:hypothetical protein